MRIAIIGPGFTGATLPLAQHLHKAGYKIDCYYFIIAGHKSIESLEFHRPLSIKKIIEKIGVDNKLYNYLDKGIDVYIMPVLKRHYTLEKFVVGHFLRLCNRVRTKIFIKWLLKKGYDRIILIDHSDETHQLGLALKRKGCKFITAYHEVLDNLIDGRMRKEVIDSLKMGVQVVVHCEDIKKKIIEKTGVDDIESRLSVIRFGPFESLWQYGEGRKVPGVGEGFLLFLGRITPYKGVKYLYEAVKMLPEKYGCKVVIAGSGKDSVLDEMKADSRFTVINRFIDNDEMVWLTQNCKAIVCPYVAASQSGLMALSSAYNKPLIATAVGAFPEVIEEGKNGYLAKPSDSKDLARAIECCIKEANRKYDYLPEKINWNYITKQYSALF